MKSQFLQYPKCGTCQKATKWLNAHAIERDTRDITIVRPSREELSTWIEKSNLPIQRFFNTSGLIYKELNLKDKVKTASKDELLDLLASNGKLVKRPIFVQGDTVLVGFKEEEWTNLIEK